MSITLLAPYLRVEYIYPPRKRRTREECAALESAGLLERNRYELIEGELIEKTEKNHHHVHSLELVRGWLREVFGPPVVIPGPMIEVSSEDMPSNEPEPDVIVLSRPAREPFSRVQPEDVQLLVEVADSSVHFDMTTKAALYAHAPIAEYWVLDISGRRLIIHMDAGHGQYRSIIAYSEEETVSPGVKPSARVRVSDLL